MNSGKAPHAWARIDDATDEDRQRAEATADPGAYHARIGSAALHWVNAHTNAWVSFDPDDQCWHGFDGQSGSALTDSQRPEPTWMPWSTALDVSDAPYFRWFDGGLTNACFNEVDRHVLAGRGSTPAFIFEGDRWDPSKENGRG
ncbi:MAG: acetyl-coenzyme A synthetase N-terminal domain-containing protein, partial [Pseudomonadota bacterium]